MSSDPSDAKSETSDETKSSTSDAQETGAGQGQSAQPDATSQGGEPVESTHSGASTGNQRSAGIDPKKVLIGSQRDPANPKLAPSKPKAVREAAQSPAVKPASPTGDPAATDGTPQHGSSEPDEVVPVQAERSETDRDEAVQGEAAPVQSADAAAQPVVSEPQAGATDLPRQTRETAALPDETEEDFVPEIHISPPSLSGDDLEKEIQEALGELSIDDLMSEKDVEATTVEVEIDGRYKATVTKIHGDNVFYSLRGHYEGVASAKQFKEPPKVGSQMDVVVTGFHSDDGIYELHIPGASVSVSDWADLDDGTVVEAKVTGANTGGLECLVGNIRGFIPASQIEIYRVENLSDYINQKLQCVVTEANPARRNLVLSHRAISEREREASRLEILERLEPGQSCDGTVTKLMDFGAFVDIGGGVDGLVHISKMSWDRIDHPKQVLEVGQQISVKVEKIDKQTGKIGLSYRDTQKHPWEDVPKNYLESTVVKGTVTRVANFGAFVKLEPGVEGLIHISELAHNRVFAVSNIVKEGDEVEVKVLSVDAENQRIGLSLKATQTAPVKQEKKGDNVEAEDEPPRELVVPRHKGPLKGGKDKPSGGEKFGLNW